MKGKGMNINLFDCFTVKILTELYGQFPVKKDFNVREFNKEFCSEYYGKKTGETITEILDGTFVFLEENELISYDKSKDGYRGGLFLDTGLTLKGLQLLKKEPNSIKERQALGDLLIEKVKERGLDNATEFLEKGLWGLFA